MRVPALLILLALALIAAFSCHTMSTTDGVLVEEVIFDVIEEQSVLLEHPLVAVSPFLLVASGAAEFGSREWLHVALKPILVQLSAVMIGQAIGLPLLSKLGILARRIRWSLIWKTLRLSQTGRVIGRPARVVQTGGQRVWKTAGSVYSRTSLSKIVNRSKKLVKVFLPHDDHHHEEEH